MRELPVLDRYSPQNLMSDGSVQFEGFDPKLLYELAEREPLLTALQHPEVRYETTDYCNATCIMCPRDLHQEGREHGVLLTGHWRYYAMRPGALSVSGLGWPNLATV